MKKTLIIFLFTTIPFGFTMSIAFEELTIGILTGLFFGLSMTFAFSFYSTSGNMTTSVKQNTGMDLEALSF